MIDPDTFDYEDEPRGLASNRPCWLMFLALVVVEATLVAWWWLV